MKCPFCQREESRVIDSRPAAAGIRRRRECEGCRRRFNTLELPETAGPLVVKKDGRREPFDRDKMTTGMRLACRKRPISQDAFESAVDELLRKILGAGEREVPTAEVGRLVLESLRDLDPVAYLRFASVYLELESAESFLELTRAVCEKDTT
jgi:transcriptional repressor NrdR